MEQQKPDCLSTDPGYQSTLDRLFGHQPNGPAGATLRRIAANHRDDPLLFSGFQHRRRTGPRFIVERLIKAGIRIAPPDLTHRFGRQPHNLRNLGYRLAFMQVLQGQGPQHRAHWLNSTGQNAGQMTAIRFLQSDLETSICPHELIVSQNIPAWKCFTITFSGGHGTSRLTSAVA